MQDEYTVGVEEEYQLVDPETRALRSRAPDVLSTDWSDELKGELHQNAVEIGTPVCGGWDELRDQLSRQRFQAATVAAAEGLEVAAAGLHPFTRWEGQAVGNAERYAAIEARHGRVARQSQIFGMHIHVGVPGRVDRIRLMERVKAFCPYLLALSASSPYVDASDTGYDSFRGVLWRQYPFMGIPPRFEDREAYDRFIDLAIRSGVLKDRASVYWSLRPHREYPTVEFRSPDVCPRLEDAATLAELVRLVVVGVEEFDLELPAGRPGPLTPDEWRAVLTENEWLAARFGLDARLTAPAEDKGRVGVRTAVRRLLDRLAPVADALDAVPVLGRVEELLERGNGARRMREVYREAESFTELVHWVVNETRLGSGFDRRRKQRTGSG